ncbi:translational machinery component [Trametes sanguinea]|nr:translational machinery component [Trametes sanguinea]
MSFLRALPAIRSRAACRASFAPFSSSASTSASAPGSSEPPEMYDALIDASEAQPRPELTDMWGNTAPSASEAQAPEVDDAPPMAPADSFPRQPSLSANPAAAANQAAKAYGRDKPLYAVSVKATRNNTIVTFARPNGTQLVTLTGGKLGFKKSNRNGYEAGYQCAVGIIGAMEEQLKKDDFDWELFLKGFGSGREAMLTAITTSVGMGVKDRLKRVTDRTPIKIGGTRGKKARRI